MDRVSSLVNVEDLKQCIEVARELHSCISREETAIGLESAEMTFPEQPQERVKLTQELHRALSVVQTQVLQQAPELLGTVSANELQLVAGTVFQLQNDLAEITDAQQPIIEEIPTKQGTSPALGKFWVLLKYNHCKFSS